MDLIKVGSLVRYRIGTRLYARSLGIVTELMGGHRARIKWVIWNYKYKDPAEVLSHSQLIDISEKEYGL
jgi:hypothetical protein